jgi:hypothetical protein
MMQAENQLSQTQDYQDRDYKSPRFAARLEKVDSCIP